MKVIKIGFSFGEILLINILLDILTFLFYSDIVQTKEDFIMKFLGTYTKFETVTGWESGPKKPTVTSAGGNAADVQALVTNIASDIASLGDGESLSFTVQAMNVPSN